MSPVAQICLYGSAGSGFAYLTLRADTSRIVTKGGWNREETQPSAELRSLTETVEAAKDSLRVFGIKRGEAVVFFPGGEHCARTPIDAFQAVGHMRIESAPVTVVTAQSIERAAREIATAKAEDAEQYSEEWFANSVAWYRRATPDGEPAPVTIIRGNLVWVSTGAGAEGRWGIAQDFSRGTRQVQVSGEWIDLPRVFMRQEAIANGIAAPARADEPGHTPHALLIDALRARVARGKTLELVSADGVHHRMRVVAASNDLGPGSIGVVHVSGTIDGETAQLVIPADYELTGEPIHPAELRSGPSRRIAVDPRTVRFVAPEAPRRGALGRASRARTAPRNDAPRNDAPRNEADPRAESWDRRGVVWHRPSLTGAASRIELHHGDLVWASFGGSSARARGVWGRIQGFAPARRKVKVGEQWFDLPLIYTYDESMARGMPPPPSAPGPKPEGFARTPFEELVQQLRSPDARGRTLKIVSTDHTPHAMRIRRIEHDVRTIHVSGTILKSEARLTLRTDTDARGAPKWDAELRKGSRSYRVDPRRVQLVAKRAAARGTP